MGRRRGANHKQSDDCENEKAESLPLPTNDCFKPSKSFIDVHNAPLEDAKGHPHSQRGQFIRNVGMSLRILCAPDASHV
jgi:hypothetical protein